MPYVCLNHDKILNLLRIITTYDAAMTDIITVSQWMNLHEVEQLLSDLPLDPNDTVDASLAEVGNSEHRRGAPRQMYYIGNIRNLSKTVLYTQRVNKSNNPT